MLKSSEMRKDIRYSDAMIEGALTMELGETYKPANKALANAANKIDKATEAAKKAAADIDQQIKEAKAEEQKLLTLIENNRSIVDADKAAVLSGELRAANEKVDYLKNQRDTFIVNAAMSLQDFEIVMATILRETENDIDEIKSEYVKHVDAIAALAEKNLAAIGYANRLLKAMQELNAAYKPIIKNYNGRHKDIAFKHLCFTDPTCIYSASIKLGRLSESVKAEQETRKKRK